jgi:BirA family biotin operon repressor/biotin-[acetyl-CoA-carboxylase] ligase
MNAPKEWHLETGLIGRRTLLFEQVHSTNSYVAGLATEPELDGLVVLAREQTAGRGQHGRNWNCPPGTGVLMSVLLFPAASIRRPALLTAWAAVSVCEAIRSTTGLQAHIKWPNDVLIQGRKVCGILIEQSRCTVVGVGLNVLQTSDDFARAGLVEAASLSQFTATPLDSEEMARALIGQLDKEYARLAAGEVAALESCWKRRLGLLGTQVVAKCQHGTYHGRLRDVTLQGVELDVEGGRSVQLVPETIQHLFPAPFDRNLATITR